MLLKKENVIMDEEEKGKIQELKAKGFKETSKEQLKKDSKKYKEQGIKKGVSAPKEEENGQGEKQ